MSRAPHAWARAFAPASSSNLGSGFDLLGHAIDGPRDEVTARRRESPGVRITALRGLPLPLPEDAARNTAGRAAMARLERAGAGFGVDLELHKGIPLGSGIGGSAASAVAAVVAVNALLDTPQPMAVLLDCALDGEAVASGARHGDNVAPSLLGGLVAAFDRPVAITAPDWLHAALVTPDQVLETRVAREVLKAPYALADVVSQTHHLAALLLGLQRGDRALLRDGLRDALVEPRRAGLSPGFVAVRDAALDAGALGAGISGAGPTLFGWFDGRAAAERGAKAMQDAFAAQGIAATALATPVAGPAAAVIARDDDGEADR
ncbi:MAG: homoserine kinase [Lysobacteraceae bacterium]